MLDIPEARVTENLNIPEISQVTTTINCGPAEMASKYLVLWADSMASDSLSTIILFYEGVMRNI